jgi:hypothetical protein
MNLYMAGRPGDATPAVWGAQTNRRQLAWDAIEAIPQSVFNELDAEIKAVNTK